MTAMGWLVVTVLLVKWTLIVSLLVALARAERRRR